MPSSLPRSRAPSVPASAGVPKFPTSNDFRLGLGYDFSVAPVGPLDFYVGPAAQVAFINNVEHNNLMLGVGAQLGLEYFFDAVPLQLSLDWRPLFTLIPGTGFGWNSFGLGIRYAF